MQFGLSNQYRKASVVVVGFVIEICGVNIFNGDRTFPSHGFQFSRGVEGQTTEVADKS